MRKASFGFGMAAAFVLGAVASYLVVGGPAAPAQGVSAAPIAEATATGDPTLDKILSGYEHLSAIPSSSLGYTERRLMTDATLTYADECVPMLTESNAVFCKRFGELLSARNQRDRKMRLTTLALAMDDVGH